MSSNWTEEEFAEFQRTGKKPKRKKKSQWVNKRVSKDLSADGRSYHSKEEYRRSLDLQVLEKAGEISDLTFQPKFVLLEFPERVTYTADFMYRRNGDVSYTIEDYKAVRSELFNLKWNLVRALFGSTYNFILTGKAYDLSKRKPKRKLEPGRKAG